MTTFQDYTKGTTTNYKIKLVNNTQELKINEDGSLSMCSDGTIFILSEYVNCADMRRSLSLKCYKTDNNINYLIDPKHNEQVKLSFTITNHILYIKDEIDINTPSKIKNIIIYNSQWLEDNLVFDNYGDGSVRWWNKNKAQVPNKNQIFTIKYVD